MRFRTPPRYSQNHDPGRLRHRLHWRSGSHLVLSETLVAPPPAACASTGDICDVAPQPWRRLQAATAPAAVAAQPQTRIVVVEWKIKKGHEQEFLDYWSQKSTIPDRSGLIAEFLSDEESRDRFPWINWAAAESDDATIFYNVGIWRQADDFMGQIGKYIDNNRPPMAFEADHRHRVFLAPVKWRVGMSQLPGKDADGVK